MQRKSEEVFLGQLNKNIFKQLDLYTSGPELMVVTEFYMNMIL